MSFAIIFYIVWTFAFLLSIDFLFFGFLAEFFKIWPGFKNVHEKVLFEERCSDFFDITGNVEYRVWGFRKGAFNWRPVWRRLTLTSNNLFIRNTIRTYVWEVALEAVNYYEVKKAPILKSYGHYIIFHFYQDGKKRHLKFRTFKLPDWIEYLSVIGIPNGEENAKGKD